MILDATTKSLELLLGGAVATNELPITVDYVDLSASTTDASSIDSISTGASALTILSAPAASTQRKVNGLSVYNDDTAAASVIVRLNNGTTTRNIVYCTLQPFDTLHYTDVKGWFATDSNGNIKTATTAIFTGTLTMNNSGGGVASGSIYDGSADKVLSYNTIGAPKADGTGASGTWPISITGNAATASSISGSAVTTALGYTPYNASNPAGYITGITGASVTTALGYTPYNATNPSGYITGITGSDVTTALGYTPDSRISVGTTASGTTITPDGTKKQYNVTALAADTLIDTPSGTPADGDKLLIRIKDNGTSRALTYTTSSGGYRAVGVTLPSATTVSTTLYLGCVYNSADSYWDVIATSQ